MINSPIRFMAMSSSAFTGSPLRMILERGIDPGDRHFLTPLARAGKSPRPTAATRLLLFHRLATQRDRGQPLAWASWRPPLAKSQRACRRNLARGKRGRAKLALVVPQAHQQQLCSQNCRSFRSSLDTGHIRPILCPRKLQAIDVFPSFHRVAHRHSGSNRDSPDGSSQSPTMLAQWVSAPAPMSPSGPACVRTFAAISVWRVFGFG